MSIFKDETYENLDWISQAVEPYEFPLNDYIATLPDKLTLTDEQIISLGGNFSKGDIMRILNISNKFNYEEKGLIQDCFKIEADKEIIVNLTTGDITGTISIVKIANHVPDDKILEHMVRMVYDYVSHKGEKRAMLELAQLLMPEQYASIAESNRKSDINSKFVDCIRNSIKSKAWNIKGYTLLIQVLTNIRNYLEDGDQAALGRLGLFSVLIKSGAPLYSMKG